MYTTCEPNLDDLKNLEIKDFHLDENCCTSRVLNFQNNNREDFWFNLMISDNDNYRIVIIVYRNSVIYKTYTFLGTFYQLESFLNETL